MRKWNRGNSRAGMADGVPLDAIVSGGLGLRGRGGRNGVIGLAHQPGGDSGGFAVMDDAAFDHVPDDTLGDLDRLLGVIVLEDGLLGVPDGGLHGRAGLTVSRAAAEILSGALGGRGFIGHV